MKIAVFGLGYVGSVTAVCLAEMGHEVWGVEIDRTKITRLCEGKAPVEEPGLEDMLRTALAAGQLHITDTAGEAIGNTELSMVCVGTPTRDEDSGTDTSAVRQVVKTIAEQLNSRADRYTIIIRSTVPPGTTEALQKNVVDSQIENEKVGLCFHPEFLREGSGVSDFFDPALLVVGTVDIAKESAKRIKDIYAGFERDVAVMQASEAELLKLACNSYHALKVAFANEVGSVAARVGADPDKVMEIFTNDTRLNISSAYLRPGFAFGGACLPKDVRSICTFAQEHELNVPLHNSILRSNEAHLDRIEELVLRSPADRIGVVGLTFKSDTDDMRESPAVKLAARLIARRKTVLLYEENLIDSELHGENLAYLESKIPDYETRLRGEREIISESDLCVVTRPGMLSDSTIKSAYSQIVEVYNLSGLVVS